MAKILDISAKLAQEEQKIKLAEGKEYVVDCSAATSIEVQNVLKNSANSAEAIFESIKLLIGEEGLQAVKDLKLSVQGVKNVFMALQAIVNEEDIEEVEARFRKQTEEKA